MYWPRLHPWTSSLAEVNAIKVKGLDTAEPMIPDSSLLCSVWCVTHNGEELGEIVAQYNIDGDAPMRMLVSHSRDFLLLAMGFGGLLRVNMVLTAEPPTFATHGGMHAPIFLLVSPFQPLTLQMHIIVHNTTCVASLKQENMLGPSRAPSLIAGEERKRLQDVGMVNCMSFSSNMRLLAVGIRDGPLQVLEWPSLALKAVIR